jgi:DNA repair protein RadC
VTECVGRLKKETDKVSNSRDICKLFAHLSDSPYEQFWIVALNRANRVVDRVMISEGGLTGIVVDPRKVYKMALVAYACGLILVHHHPSGNIMPSDADKAITKKLIGADTMLDIIVLDHIIVGNNEYFSVAETGYFSVCLKSCK